MIPRDKIVTIADIRRLKSSKQKTLHRIMHEIEINRINHGEDPYGGQA